MNSTGMQQWGIAVLRVVTGIVLLAHGWQKIFVFGLSATGNFFGQIGIPLPSIAGPAIAILEFAGGIALVLGILARWVAILFAIEMLVAVLKVHLGGGFFLPKGFEYALLVGAANAAIALAGPGAAAVYQKPSQNRGGGGSAG